jgi:hypothetical protein
MSRVGRKYSRMRCRGQLSGLLRSAPVVLLLCSFHASSGAGQVIEMASEAPSDASAAERRTLRPATVMTLAGNGREGRSDGSGAAASFYRPTDIALSHDERFLVVADSWNHQIRRVERPANGWASGDGLVKTLAGSGLKGAADGDAQIARFWLPQGVAISPDSQWVAVADTNNNKIRRVDAATGVVSTIAGSGEANYKDGKALTATFRAPTSVRFTSDGNLLLIADGGNGRIRQLNLASGEVSTLAGSRCGPSRPHVPRDHLQQQTGPCARLSESADARTPAASLSRVNSSLALPLPPRLPPNVHRF